jgi:hypothetical protein
VLFTAASTLTQAVQEYAQRMPSEETLRDWHPGWAVREAVRELPTAAMVARLSGVVCLASGLQLQLGQRLSLDPTGQQRRAQWTVTDRVSWFWCGQRLFTDSGHDWQAWLTAQWEALTFPRVSAERAPVSTLLLAEAA